MADINYDDLIASLKESESYRRWEMEVPAEVSLYVSFSKNKDSVTSHVLQLSNGAELIIDRREDGIVVGFEIS